MLLTYLRFYNQHENNVNIKKKEFKVTLRRSSLPEYYELDQFGIMRSRHDEDVIPNEWLFNTGVHRWLN